MENIKTLQELKEKFNNLTIVLDDGRDSDNLFQNKVFTKSIKELESFRGDLANIEIEGLDLNALWKEAWGDMGHISNLPEAKHMHTARYIELIEQELKNNQQ